MGGHAPPAAHDLFNMGPVTLQAPVAPIFRRLVTGTVRAGVEDLGGRPAMVVRSVSSLRRGALSIEDGETIRVAATSAATFRIPLVAVLASSGANVADGVASLHGWGQAARAMAACSGIVPVIVVVTGPAISGPALLLGIADLVVMTSDSVRLRLRPGHGRRLHRGADRDPPARRDVDARPVERAVRHRGGHRVGRHGPRGAPVEPAPGQYRRAAARGHGRRSSDRPVDELRDIIPDRATSSYDVRRVAAALADETDITELWTRWSPQLVTALGRVDGRTVGFVANQPQALAGTLDIAASQKGARFVRFCDAFNVPLITLVDTPGFLPGKDLEWRGMIRHGAELAFAYAEATVPRVCVILRKAFGGAYIVMDSKGLGNDLCFAWPGAEIAVMGAEGAVQILHRRVVEPEERQTLQDDYAARFLTPWQASERGFVDAVIDPGTTRAVVADALGSLGTLRELLPGRKHTVGPL